MAQLLGPDGEPIRRELLTREIAGPELTGVRQPLGGHPSDGLTPARLAGLLRDAEQENPERYLELAEDMEEKETQYLTVLGVRKRAVAQLEITVEPASDSADDIANKDLVELALNRDSLEDELFDILDAIGKGFSLTEIVWETSEKQWMPKAMNWVDPRWVQFDRRDMRTPLLKTMDGGTMPLPWAKFVWCQIKAKSGIPVRSGLARPIAWCYLFKNFDIKGWLQFAEVYGQPIRVGKHHAGATAEERRQLLRAVAGIGRDAAAIIPQGMEIDFIEAANKSSASDFYERLARYMDQSISKLVLGQTTTTDAISGGHAVGREHNDVRGDIERADAKTLAAILNASYVRPLIDLNRGPQKAYPKIRIGRTEQVDVAGITSALGTLVPLGLKVSAKDVRAKVGIAEPESDDDLLQPHTAPAAPEDRPPAPPAENRPVALQARRGNAVAGDVVDDLTARMMEADGWEMVADPLIDPIRQLLDRSHTEEDFINGLESLLKEMDDAPLQEKLARAGFILRMGTTLGAVE